MTIDDVDTDDTTAMALLGHILRTIAAAFPGAKFSVEPHPDTNNIIFYVNRKDGARCVEVTETFLDADAGFETAFSRLKDLGTQLRWLAAGNVLIVTADGLLVQATEF
ncbi:MAG: hypothetical protein ACRD1Q_06890 [Vicinamibacterales bacterium]